MQGREHHVARLRRLDRDLARLLVADLAHHDDVRVLAQERLQRDGESKPRLVVHVDLVDAREVDLRRIFRGGNVDLRLVEDVEAGIEGDGLA